MPGKMERELNKFVDNLIGGSGDHNGEKLGDSYKSNSLVKTASAQNPEYNRQKRYRTSFLTMTDMELPDDYRMIFRWCRYFFKFDPLVGPAVRALATFPITDYILNDSEQGETQTAENKDSQTLKFYKNMLRDIKLTKLLMEIGYNYFLYANVVLFAEPMMKEYRYRENGEIKTKKELTWKSINILDPSLITKDIDPVTNETIYYYEVPADIKMVIQKQKPLEKYKNIPDIYKKAVKAKKPLKLNNKFVYDLSMPKEAGDTGRWATPPMLHALKLILYTNVLRQAQEAIAYEHIVPKRIYYFEETQQSAAIDNFEKVAHDFAMQLNKQLRDPNYQVISPIPIQEVNHGGMGKNLLLTPEIDQCNNSILAAMRCPREFIFGGMSYSGSTTSLRILENDFITYRELLKDFCNDFLIKRLAELRGEWEVEDDDDALVTLTFADLKMQDDIQQKEMIVRLNSSQKVSDEFLHEKVLGVDSNKMKDQIEKEMIKQNELQVQMQQQQMQAQMQMGGGEMQEGEEAPPEEQSAPDEQQGAAPKEQGNPEGQGNPSDEQQAGKAPSMTPQQLIERYQLNSDMFTAENELNGEGSLKVATILKNATPEQVEAELKNFGYQTQTAIRTYIEYLKDREKDKTDMRPMPEKLPPRREGGV